MTKVSVLMSVYNAQQFLQQTLSSVLKQTYKDFELICIDDKSTDQSLQKIKEIANTDSRIRLVEHHSNLGVAKTRNECLSLANGHYLMFLDADDYLELDAIETCVAEAERHKADITLFKQDLITNPGVQFDIVPTSLNDRNCVDLWGRVFNREDVPDTIFQLGANLCGALYKTEFLKSSKLSFGNYQLAEGMPFINLALVKADRIVALNKVLYHQRWWHGQNLTQLKLGDPRRYYQALLDLKGALEHKHLLEEHQRSLVNLITDVLVEELEAQQGYAAYTAAAKFYRAYGFDELGIIGYPEHYYYNHRHYAKLRQIVLGDVYSNQDRYVMELEAKNHSLNKLEKQNSRLKSNISKHKKLDLAFIGKQFSKAAKARLSFKNKSNEVPNNGLMNTSTGYRFKCICNNLLEMNLDVLVCRRHDIADSITLHKLQMP